MKVGLTVLGSGSKGNLTAIQYNDTTILFDNGFSKKEACRRLEAAGIDPKTVKAVIVSHEHSDHVKGVRVFCDFFDIPSYSTIETHRYISSKNYAGKKSTLFDPGTPFKVEDIRIEPFTVPHDAVQPVAFVIKIGEFKFGLATDLGHVNKLALQRLYDCNILVLESNYDMEMLKKAERPLSLKRRIMGKHGHLDNQDALEALDFLLTPKTSHLIMAHVSNDCNDYDLVEKQVSEKLDKLDRTDIVMHVAKQDTGLETIWVDNERV